MVFIFPPQISPFLFSGIFLPKYSFFLCASRKVSYCVKTASVGKSVNYTIYLSAFFYPPSRGILDPFLFH